MNSLTSKSILPALKVIIGVIAILYVVVEFVSIVV